jgi:polyisoprenyl-phosphate glycosyltransferase
MTKNPSPLISIIVPAYNESKSLKSFVSSLTGFLDPVYQDYEVIIVDDGSTDTTYALASALTEQDARIKSISFSRNFGKESALLAGLKYSSGSAVITIDADGQHPPELVPSMIEKWQAGAMIVNAVKNTRGDESKAKKLAAQWINGLISSLGGINVNNSSDYKLLDREVVDILINELPEKERFFRGLTYWVGFENSYIYFDVAPRIDDHSKWSFNDLFELSITAITSFTSAPLRIITILGLLTLVLGTTIGIDALWSLAHQQSVSGFATIIMTLLIIGSFIMISLGIIGEYIAKIYEEVKSRPVYFIKSQSGFQK